MATPVWIEGWEHGVLSTSGSGIVNAIAGTVDTNIAVTATAKRTGNYGLRVYPSSSTAVNITRNISGTQYCLVGRFYFKLPATLPTTNHTICRALTSVQQMLFGYDYNSGSPRFYMQWNAGTPVYTAGGSCAADTWYRLDFRADTSTGTSTIDWKLDGVDQTQATRTVSSANITIFNLGITTAAVGNIYYDDVILSVTSGDYAFGAGEVIGLYPSGAGTSNLDTNIEDDGSVDVNDSSNPANIELDEDPLGSGTDYIKQIGGTSSIYAAVAFANTTESTIVGASAFEAYRSAAASPANSASARIYDEDGTETAIYTGDMTESSTFYKSVVLPAPSGGWDQSAVDALQGRVGYATDYAPVPYWYGLMVQVAYVPSTAINLVPDQTGSQGQSGDSVTGMTQVHEIASDQTGSQAQSGDTPTLETIVNLVPDSTGAQAQAGDNAVLDVIVAVNLVPDQTGFQSQAGDSVSGMTQVHNISADSTGAQGQAGDSASLTQVHNIVSDSTGAQGQAGDTPTLTVGVIELVPAEGSHGQTGDNASLTQVHNLASDSTGSQAQAGDNAVLDVGSVNLVPAEGSQGQAGDSPVLTQVHNLTSDSTGAQAQSGDNAVLDVGTINLVPSEGSQGQAGDGDRTLTQVHNLAVGEGSQTQIGDGDRVLTQVHNLVVGEGSQGQAGDLATLILGALVYPEIIERIIVQPRVHEVRVEAGVSPVIINPRIFKARLRRTE